MLKKIFFLFLLYTSGSVILPACNTDNICNEKTISLLKVGFYCRYYSNDRYLTKDSIISISGLNCVGSNFPLIYDTTVNVSKLYLPLSQNADSSTFEIVLDKYTDRYTVKYKRNRVFINYDCGFRTDFILDTLTSMDNRIDSIIINKSLVTETDDEHIKIYFYRPVSGNN